ncbi:TadE/TadG family type IV pilus assembly protein [Thalassotalea litorea]|uniref:TadE/TadG family type IV pilus assembly protein n=1 Tax=Thalassotalea litorea TaxID=2020715 RepID=UPI003735E20E
MKPMSNSIMSKLSSNYAVKTSARKQRGNIIVVFTIALFSLIGLCALALDGGHMLLSKSRLQNIVDAAALHAAKEIDLGATHGEARLAALSIINQNLASPENDELESGFSYSAFDSENVQVTPYLEVDFSERPDPFNSSSDPSATYVKVVISALDLDSYLATIFGFNKQVSASAMAGPSTEIVDCYNDLAPLLACGLPAPEGSTQEDYLFGYEYGEVQLLKIGSNSQGEVGPGNFHVVDLPGGKGANYVSENLAGAAFNNEICFSPSTAGLETKTGDMVGKIYAGLNTRWGLDDNGKFPAIDFPRDVNTCMGDFLDLDSNNQLPEIVRIIDYMPENPSSRFTAFMDNMSEEIVESGYYIYDENEETYKESNLYDHASYEATYQGEDNQVFICPEDFPSATQTSNNGDIVEHNILSSGDVGDYRRILNIPIAECTGDANGHSTLSYLGTGCFYVMQPVSKMGKAGQTSFIVGQFIENCTSEGTASWQATDNNGPYTIVLYHVPDSTDS